MYEKLVSHKLSSFWEKCGLLCLSENWYFEVGETYIVDTVVLLHCYFAFVLQILEYCSPVWGSDAECHLQLLERQVYSVAKLCPD